MKKLTVEIHHYQITGLVALTLILWGISFLTGFFWGKKSAFEEFAEHIKNESFSDKVYASLCSIYEQPGQQLSSSETLLVETVAAEEEQDTPPPAGTQFVAQLIGYGTERQAQVYLKTLEKRCISAQVVARTSISAQGKKRVWYQVVTTPLPYEETKRIVERLAIEDRLAGVAIVEETEKI